MRARTIKGSPERSASAAWTEIERMIAETLQAASAIDDAAVRAALDALAATGRALVAGGVLSDAPIVLRAQPLQLEITVALGNAALLGGERLGKVPGAAEATEWRIYVPDPEPWAAQVRAAVASHEALHAGPGAAEPAVDPAKAAAFSAAAEIDAGALRRISGGTR